MRRDCPTGEIGGMLLDAKRYGLEEYPRRIREIQQRWPLSEEEIHRYFSVHIHFDMAEAELESLKRFYAYAGEAGLIREALPLVLA